MCCLWHDEKKVIVAPPIVPGGKPVMGFKTLCQCSGFIGGPHLPRGAETCGEGEGS